MTTVRRLKKVLVANRGEIAVRIMRTLRELGITTVAVFSEADRDALHVRYADEAYLIGPPPSAQSYLLADKLVETALRCGAEAIHPGYGFLSERAAFARKVEEAGLTWIGPPPSAIDAMGDKVRARTLMIAAGVPVVPGTAGAIADPAEAREAARQIGFPVLIKASAGGGGKGMRRVDDEASFERAFAGASREALSAFGSGEVYVEKLLINPRHVEFQVFADNHGNTVHLFERDCSVQRRHQKVIEETPCPVLREDVRQRMGQVAVQAAQAVGYQNAGTIELLLDHDQSFYFLEMNTRLQVEHPITEAITGLDLVELQIRVAEGDPLPFTQDQVTRHGAAIEVRLYAEDPQNRFMPSPGHLAQLRFPSGPHVRVDAGVYAGCTVSPFYDPLMAKLTVWGADRPTAIQRMRRALSELVVTGIKCNAEFLDATLAHPDFVSGHYDIGFVDRHLDALNAASRADDTADVAAIAAVVAAVRRDESRGQKPAGDNGRGTRNRWRDLGRLRQLR